MARHYAKSPAPRDFNLARAKGMDFPVFFTKKDGGEDPAFLIHKWGAREEEFCPGYTVVVRKLADTYANRFYAAGTIQGQSLLDMGWPVSRLLSLM